MAPNTHAVCRPWALGSAAAAPGWDPPWAWRLLLRVVVTRGDPLSACQPSDCLLPALQPPASSGAWGLITFVPSRLMQGTWGHRGHGAAGRHGPMRTVHSLGSHLQVRSLCRGSAADRTPWSLGGRGS